MAKISFILFFLFAFNTVKADNLIKVEGEKSSEFQESAFIKLMNHLNEGQIPYPFSNLLDSFNLNIRKEGNIVFIPDGRSLVKNHADYKNPRIIVNPIDNPPDEKALTDEIEKQLEKIKKLGINRGDIYIGFVPNQSALEIISFNPKKGAFDFFIIEDYEKGKTPKVIHNPDQCLSCHQNGGPIFSRFPWSEALGDSAFDPSVAGKIFTDEPKNGPNQIMNLIREANKGKQQIEGIDITSHRFNELMINSFDIDIRESNKKLLKKEVCEALCENNKNINCQKKLFELSVNNEANFNKDLFKNFEKKIFAIDLKSSVIPNRDPFNNLGFRVVVPPDELAKYDEIYGNKPLYDVTFEEVPSMNLGKKELDNPVSEATFFDPTTPRSMNTDLLRLQHAIKKSASLKEKVIKAVNVCLDYRREIDVAFSPNNLSAEELPSESDKIQILNSPRVLKALMDWPDLTIVLNAISDETKVFKKKSEIISECRMPLKNEILIYEYSDVGKIVEKVNDEFIKKPQNLFKTYCVQCHSEGSFISLPLDSLEKMANYIPNFGKKSPKERLESNNMPPANAKQPSQKEREEMIKVLQDLRAQP